VKLHTLSYTQRIPRPVDEVFSFFRSPENLAAITPSWLEFRILTPPPLPMDAGAVIDYSIAWAGLRMHWRTLITGYDPPREFVDQQIKGPYLMWHHRHTFVALEGCTEMTDTVTYALPLGVLGSFAHSLIVRRQLRRIFAFRAAAITKRFSQRPLETDR
jgi:hypothetical protein